MARTTPSSGSLPAIVVGLDCVTGLQTARILAKRGVQVIGDPLPFLHDLLETAARAVTRLAKRA